MEMLTEQQKDIKLQEIATQLGIAVATLTEGKTKDQVIAEYSAGKFGMLNS